MPGGFGFYAMVPSLLGLVILLSLQRLHVDVYEISSSGYPSYAFLRHLHVQKIDDSVARGVLVAMSVASASQVPILGLSRQEIIAFYYEGTRRSFQGKP